MLEITSEKIQPIVDVCYIRAEKNKHSHYKSEHLDIIIDTVFKPHTKENATQDGIVVAFPAKTSTGVPIEVSEGDHVYVTHSICDKENELMYNGEVIYQANYQHEVFCKIVDGEIIMLNTFNFIEPILEDESNYKTSSGIWIKPEAENQQMRGRVAHAHQSLLDMGVKVGDIVMFMDFANYEMIVEGKVFYRMRTEDIIGVVN